MKKIFTESGDGSNDDLLNCMQAFEDLLDKGFIEQFVNDSGEIDYRPTGRTGSLDILLGKKESEDFGI